VKKWDPTVSSRGPSQRPCTVNGCVGPGNGPGTAFPPAFPLSLTTDHMSLECAVYCRCRSSRFAAGRQNDSHELLRHLLEIVKEEEKVLSQDCIASVAQN